MDGWACWPDRDGHEFGQPVDQTRLATAEKEIGAHCRWKQALINTWLTVLIVELKGDYCCADLLLFNHGRQASLAAANPCLGSFAAVSVARFCSRERHLSERPPVKNLLLVHSPSGSNAPCNGHKK